MVIMSNKIPCSAMPDDVIVLILMKLPPKSLIRFKVVCKSWQEIISCPIFIRARSSSVIRDNPRIQMVFKDFNGKATYLVHRVKSPHEEVMCLQPPFCKKRNDGVEMVGSFNGLVCMTTSLYDDPSRISFNPRPRIFIWNPTNMEYRTIIDHRHQQTECAIHAFADYKVVKITYFREDVGGGVEVRVYDLMKNSWKTIGGVSSLPFYLLGGNYVFVNGVVHWQTRDPYPYCFKDDETILIGTFDMAAEVFGAIEAPSSSLHYLSRTIAVTPEGLLSLFVTSPEEYVVWVMDRYGTPDSWTKKHVITAFEPPSPSIFLQFLPIGFVENGLIFEHLQYGWPRHNRLFLYDPTIKKIDDLGIDGKFSWVGVCDVTIYKESFLSLKLSNCSDTEDGGDEIQEEGLIRAGRRILDKIMSRRLLAPFYDFSEKIRRST